jgi:multidrug efflux pump subunit AcrA (membrane-fusion protein)
MQVEIDVPNPAGTLTPGMYADVSLNIQRSGDALVVPVQTVDQTGTYPFMMLVNSANQVEKRVVQAGISTANRTEILSGLKEGDKVIVANLATFQPGEVVTPKRSVLSVDNSNGEDQ